MKTFLTWYEDRTTDTEPLIKAGLAHLYFVTVHPLEDGNGRIARAITEMSLARLEDSAQRFYSMSSTWGVFFSVTGFGEIMCYKPEVWNQTADAAFRRYPASWSGPGKHIGHRDFYSDSVE